MWRGSVKDKIVVQFGPIFELSARQKSDFKEAFDMCDPDGIGKIDAISLRVAFRALGFETKVEELREMFNEMDTDNSGLLSFENFLDLMIIKMSETDTTALLTSSFRLFDSDNTQNITFDKLKQIAIDIEEDINDEELLEMIEYANLNRSGKVTEMEYFKIMNKTFIT